MFLPASFFKNHSFTSSTCAHFTVQTLLSTLIRTMIKTKQNKKKHEGTQVQFLKRDFCKRCVMLKKEKHWKETIRTKGFGENTIFTCFGFKLNIKKDIFIGGRLYERGFSVSLCQRIWGLRQVILQIGTSISLKTYEICLAEKSLVCSWLHLREKKKIYISALSLSPVWLFFYFLTVMTALLTEKYLKL